MKAQSSDEKVKYSELTYIMKAMDPCKIYVDQYHQFDQIYSIL